MMSVRIEGDMEFQRWYYEKYGDVASIVSNEVYAEYLNYKEEHSFINRLLNKIF